MDGIFTGKHGPAWCCLFEWLQVWLIVVCSFSGLCLWLCFALFSYLSCVLWALVNLIMLFLRNLSTRPLSLLDCSTYMLTCIHAYMSYMLTTHKQAIFILKAVAGLVDVNDEAIFLTLSMLGLAPGLLSALHANLYTISSLLPALSSQMTSELFEICMHICVCIRMSVFVCTWSSQVSDRTCTTHIHKCSTQACVHMCSYVNVRMCWYVYAMSVYRLYKCE